MAAKKKSDDEDRTPRRPPTSRKAQQAYMENLAMQIAEKQMRDGDASSQVITHFLRSASTRGQIEELKLQHEIELMKAKKSQIESQEQLQKMFQEAIEKMGSYQMEDEEGGENGPI